jgi:hypothetical protein
MKNNDCFDGGLFVLSNLDSKARNLGLSGRNSFFKKKNENND